ncbi:MAG: transglycosylase SLT domain-containing protein [Candidatus Binatia bacterium]
MPQKISLFALLLLLVLPAARLAAQGDDGRVTFKKAYSLYTQGNGGQAKELFHKTLDSGYRLADYSLYYLALIAFKESNWEQSRQYLLHLKQRFPQSIWQAQATLQRAKLDQAEKKFAAANEILRQLRTDKSVAQDIADEASYLTAHNHEAQGDLQRAYNGYQELRGNSPTSRWAGLARKDQYRLREKYPEQFALSSLTALADEADRLARERQLNDADALYKRILDSVTEADQRLRLLTKLAAIRGRADALPLLEQIARDFPDSSEAPKALYQIGQTLWNRHENGQAFEYFKQLLQRYPSSAYADRANFAAGDIHEYFGRKPEAIQLYTTVQKQFPSSSVRDDAVWRLAWLHYRASDWQTALTTFKALAAQARNGSFGTAALYWQARSAEKLGDAESAKQLYRQIFNGGEESYYQTLSQRALERLGEPVQEVKLSKPIAAAESDPAIGAEASFHLSRARELTALGIHGLAVAELDQVNRRANPKNWLQPLLMREYFANHAYGRSLNLASQLPISQSERNYYRYPLAYWELVQQKAQERELDPHLILALIRQESMFDPRARSPATALGLMQLIPPTAARVAKQLGLPVPTRDKLFEPELNVALGTQYLKDLLQRYSNNWFKAIAAYNAGEAAVDRWEREIVTDDIEEFVERIPYSETRGYVKLVLRNHRIYKRLYEQ